MHSLVPLSLILTTFFPVYAYKFPFTVETVNHPTSSLARRAASSVPIINNYNAQYVANITLAGQPLRVLLDSGSSDLWVNFIGTPPQTKDLGKSLSLTYAIGKAAGNINTAPLQFDGTTIPDQAFLLVTDASSFSSNIHSQGYDGLMGLGPNEGSKIYDKVDDAGASVLSRIFSANKSSTNFVTFLLNRLPDPGTAAVKQNFTGQFTVNEYAPGFESIASAPQLDVETVHKLLDSEQHWQALTDKDNGFIGPDGQVIKVSSIVPKAPSGQLVVVFDSGFTFNQVPRDLSDAIYGRVKGAVYDSKKEWWTVPCGQLLNVTVNIGGKSFPVHPLDTVDNNFGIMDAQGNTMCIGSFQPITTAFSLLGNYDMILGMSFLRNAYTLLNFGDWIDGGNGDPYIQLLSTTDVNQAHSDFVATRMGGVDTTSDPKWNLLPTDQMQHSPVSDEEKKKKYQEMILSRWPYIFVGCLVFVILVVAFIVWRCCCRRRRQAKKEAASTTIKAEMMQQQYQNDISAPSPAKFAADYPRNSFGSHGSYGSHRQPDPYAANQYGHAGYGSRYNA